MIPHDGIDYVGSWPMRGPDGKLHMRLWWYWIYPASEVVSREWA